MHQIQDADVQRTPLLRAPSRKSSLRPVRDGLTGRDADALMGMLRDLETSARVGSIAAFAQKLERRIVGRAIARIKGAGRGLCVAETGFNRIGIDADGLSLSVFSESTREWERVPQMLTGELLAAHGFSVDMIRVGLKQLHKRVASADQLHDRDELRALRRESYRARRVE